LSTVFDGAREMISPSLGKPIKVNGLMGVPSSLLFQSPHQMDVLRLLITAKRGIKNAINKRKIFHITMHDYMETYQLLEAFFNVLSYAVKEKQEGKIDIVPMCSLFKDNNP
jgi:hypothetical protein